MKKAEAKGWIAIIQNQPFPVVTREILKQLYKIAEMEDKYPKHDYLVASDNVQPSENLDRIMKSLNS